MYCSLLWLTLHIRAGINISHLSFLRQQPMAGVIYPAVFNKFSFFLPAVVLHCLSFSACIFQTRINLTSFLFTSNFISFPICDSAYLLSHYYYYYNFFFITYYYFFLRVLFCYYLSFSLFSNVKVSLILLLPLSSLSIF